MPGELRSLGLLAADEPAQRRFAATKCSQLSPRVDAYRGQEAQRILGVTSKSDAVVLSLTEIVRRKRLEELKAMRGKVELRIDVAASRRRLGRPPKTSGSARAQRGR